MSHNNIYSDDYRQHDASYDQQHPYQAHQSTFERNDYHENPPYDDDSIVQPHHPEIMTADDYRQYPSTEKIVGDEYQTPNTARAQPGRSGLRDNSTSWAAGPPPRSTGILRMWRHDERGKQWLRGGGLRSTLRICCCCTTITVIMIISIVLAILLYVRPPNVALKSINLGTSPVALTSTGLTVNFDISVSINNPNWFSVNFEEVNANARYPGNNNSFGGGALRHVNLAGYANSGFDFPFTLNYTTALDPNRTILNDIISKCGLNGGTASSLTIDYDLHLKLKVLGVTISPTVSNSASFDCPTSELQGVIGGVGNL